MVVRAMNGYGWFSVMDSLEEDYRTGNIYRGLEKHGILFVPSEIAGEILTLSKYSFRK